MKLINVVLFLGQNYLEAVVETSGKRQRIRVSWHQREGKDTPPTDWFDMVQQEASFRSPLL